MKPINHNYPRRFNRPITFLLCFLLHIGSFGQSLQKELELKYSSFNDSFLTTSFLYNQSANFSNIESDTISVDSTVTTSRMWLQCLLDLKSGQRNLNSINSTSQPTEILKKTAEYARQNIHPIGMITVNINTIPIEYFSESAITFDSTTNQLNFSNYDYTLNENRIFKSGLLNEIVEGSSLNLLLSSNLIFNDEQIDSVYIEIPQIDHHQLIQFNTVYEINIEGVLANEYSNLTLTAYVGSKLFRRNMQFKRLVPIEKPDQTITNFEFAGSCPLIAPKGFGEAEAYILYSSIVKKQNQLITSPLIIVEGYDPSPKDFGSIGWRTYMTGMSYNIHGELVYPQLEKMPDLINELLAKEYDLIFVNFKTSSDYIEKNAATLAKIIQWTENIKSGDKKIGILGASMGGLLCQTAMNILNNSNCPVCIGTFVAYDSPFHGAHVPIGVQQAAKYFYETQTKAIEQFEFSLNVPAARQMLYNHVVDNSDRAAWINYFKTFDKKLAEYSLCLVSSSKEGLSNGINNGDELLTWDLVNKTTYKSYGRIRLFAENRYDNLTFEVMQPTADNLIGVPKKFETTKFYYNGSGYNLSGAPGSLSGFIQSMYDEILSYNSSLKGFQKSMTKSFGPNMPKGPYHTFVPTVSAIDYFSNDPTSALSQVNWLTPNNLSPFDVVVFSDFNNIHIKIENDDIIAVSEYLDLLQKSSYNIILPFNGVNEFNLSEFQLNTFTSFQVPSGSTIHFNSYQISNYGLSTNDHFPEYNKIFARSSNCGTHVICESYGAIELGGVGPTNQEFQAQVEFRKGSILELQSDAVLRIRDNSTLIIEEGATLIYHPGAKIYLEGENAVLEIRGTLQLENNAVFTFEKGNANKGGLVRFNLSGNNPAPIQAMGPNCRINLLGEAYFADKVLEISGDSKLTLPYSLNNLGIELAEFKVVDGVIGFDGNGSLDAGCALHLQNTTFFQSTDGLGTGLITHGQANLFIEDCRFENFMLGLKALNNDLGNNFSITDNRFFNCNDGLHTIGRNVQLDGGSLSTCGFGLILEGTLDAVISGTEVLYNDFGLETRGSNTHVRIEDAWFLKNNVFGIFDFEETRFTISCTPFEENGTGIYTNGKVNMTPLFVFPGQSLGGGNNTFFNNQTGMEFFTGEVQLKNGGNNFIMPASYVMTNFLVGSLTASASYIPNNLLDASGNYFSHLPASGIGAGSGSLYMLTSYGGISPNGAPVLLNGTVLPAMNSTCFSFPRIYPDSKKELAFTPEEYDLEAKNTLQQLSAYPNPSNDIVILEAVSGASGVRDLVLYDMQGKEIYRSKWALIEGTNRLELPLKSLADPGMYLLKVIGAEGTSQVIRLTLSY